MTKVIIRRLIIAVPLLVAITIVSFTFINLAPGDPVSALIDPELGQAGSSDALRERYGLNKPIIVRYFIWLRELATGNMGFSYQSGQPVAEMIGRRVLPTLELTLTAFVISTIFGTLFGVISALKQYSFYDYSLSVVSLFGISIPNFFFALLALWIFGAILGWFPTFGMGKYGEPFNIWDNLYHLVLPATVLSIDSLAGNTRYARTSMLEVMHSDYITTARAKGLSRYAVIGRHGFRNALIPIITITTLRLPGLIGGTILIENMFAWPGMGQLTVASVGYRDYSVLMGLILITAVMVLLANLLADILYTYTDPRVRIEDS